MRFCQCSLPLVVLGSVLLLATKSGKATVQRKARQTFDDFEEEYDIPGSCPQGWIGHEGSCYSPFVHGATWQEAEDTCREFDAHLALSRSESENEFIAEEVGRPESRVWIGLRRKEGEFVWSDGQKAEYTNWRNGEPKGSSSGDCVSLLPEDIFSSWEVTKCDNMQAFICERASKIMLRGHICL
ncbi:snaclec coagulation factor IX-binding protein subunit A-like [Porites lutea]|uniref:snaclec coagulation factor IX-binding protein subunit A-like n=1 Tax=Porites lutea TaxID=51062 RepID=UPI003CC6C997